MKWFVTIGGQLVEQQPSPVLGAFIDRIQAESRARHKRVRAEERSRLVGVK